MGVKDAGTFSERAKKNTAVDSAEGWAVDNVVFAHDTIEKSTTGSLKHLENPIKYAEHSQFDVSISLKNTAALNVRRKLIPEGFAGYLAIFCCVMLVFLIKIENTLLKNRPKTVWLFQFIVALLLIHSAETFLTKELLKDAAPKYRIVGIAVFDVLFCLVPALFVHLAMQVFIWGPMEQRSGRPVPTVLRHIPVYLIYFIAGYAVIVFVFNLDINKLVATSGVLAMGIGLLIKDNIANYLASIAIFHNHELRIGHWVKIGDFEEGKVQEITRMVTRIMKREGTLLSIPNSVVLNSAIENYSLPGDDYLLTFRLETVPEYSPVEVLQVIETGILSVEGVLKDPAPIIVFEGQGDSSAKYTIMFSVRDYDKKYHYLTAGWKGVWLNLEKAGIELATPHRVIHLLDETPESRTD
jgi:branched-chain amino acid transport system substrate-binding protein